MGYGEYQYLGTSLRMDYCGLPTPMNSIFGSNVDSYYSHVMSLRADSKLRRSVANMFLHLHKTDVFAQNSEPWRMN